MSDIVPTASFNSGEWAPSLFARVDIAKYRSGAKLLENFFVDYRGGAANRAGTKYIIKALSDKVRLIPFQVTSTDGYILEFGDHYIRFIFQGAMVLEAPTTITAAAQVNPVSVTASGHGLSVGDVVFVTGIVGMTPLNGRYFQVQNTSGAQVFLENLFGDNIDGTAFPAYVSGGSIARVYKIVSPYGTNDLAGLKYAQMVDQMVICSPSYVPYILTENAPDDWTINPIVFGSTASPPGLVAITTTLSSGTVNYGYVVTSVDGNGQESVASAVGTLGTVQDLRSVAGTNTITWSTVDGANFYNVYKADVSYAGVVGATALFGYIGYSYSNSFDDSNVAPDFTLTPPIATTPFTPGGGILTAIVTLSGLYSAIPRIAVVGASTAPVLLRPDMGVVGTPAVAAAGTGYAANDTVSFPNGVVAVVNAVGGGGAIASYKAITVAPSNQGSFTGATAAPVPTNPQTSTGTSGGGTGATANFQWGVVSIIVVDEGAFLTTPTLIFTTSGLGSTATGTVTLSNPTDGNPTVPGFFQERLVLAATPAAPQTFYMSQPGQFFNFNVSNPVRASDSITGTLVSGVLNTIQSVVTSTSGMLMLGDNGSWIVNGGSPGAAVSPSNIVATAQSYNGANFIRPIVANYDVLYVQQKGSSVRDLAFNIYFNVFTGTDISIVSSHLFLGYQILEWAWAEEPFKIVWAVRDDGIALSCTFMKEQEFTAWAHHVTDGFFQSVAAVTEAATNGEGNVDATYFAVLRGEGSPTFVDPPGAYTLVFWDDSCHLFVSTDSGVTWAQSETSAPTLSDEWTDFAMAPNDGDFVNFLAVDERVTPGAQGGLVFGALTNIAALTSAPLVNWGTQPFGFATGTQSSDYAAYSTATNTILTGPNGISGGGALIPRISTDGGATWSNTPTLTSTNGWMGCAFNQNATVMYIHEITGHVWKSSDSGASWGVLSSSPVFNNATGGEAARNTYRIRCNQVGNIVAALEAPSFLSDQGGKFYLSTNGGTTWNLTDFFTMSGAQTNSMFAGDFGMTPTGSKFAVMVSGIDPGSGNYQPYVWTSTDGTSWTQIFPPWGVSVGRPGLTMNMSQDGLCIAIGYSRASDTVFHADVTTDGGTTWSTVTFPTSPPDAVSDMTTAYVFGSAPPPRSGLYIERMADRVLKAELDDAWFVDSALARAVGTPASTFYGAEHLGGMTVTGLTGDPTVVTPFVMPMDGTFTLAAPTDRLTIGLGFNADLETLDIEVGDPSIQSKVKKIPAVTVRVAQTSQLKIGPDFDNLIPMKDLVPGNVSSALVGLETQVVAPFIKFGDARTFMAPSYNVPGRYCFRQDLPLPVTILGVFPWIDPGDDRP